MFGSEKSLTSLSKLILLGAMALASMAGAAQAGRPIALSLPQMDQISAGALVSVPSCSAGGACASITSSSTSSVVTYVQTDGTLTTASTTTNQVDCVSGCVILEPGNVQNSTLSTPMGTSPGASGGAVVIPTGSVTLYGSGAPP